MANDEPMTQYKIDIISQQMYSHKGKYGKMYNDNNEMIIKERKLTT